MTGPRDAGEPSPQRVSGMRVPVGWTLPGKPDGLDDTAEDAWRQTAFTCAEDLRLAAANLDLQARLAATGYTASARTMVMAGYAGLWSRAFSATSDSIGLVRRGAHQSALPLLRQAAEFIAAQRLDDAPEAWRRWTHAAYGRNEPARAVEIPLGERPPEAAIAADEHLRLIARATDDLGGPAFGPTALFVANEATRERYPLNFADHAFHLGWAELLLGWALRLGLVQLRTSLDLGAHFPAPDALRAEAAAHLRDAEALLASRDRCHLEESPDAGGTAPARLLLVQFRRRPGDAPRRVLL
ncbi:MAG: hypothetical protein WC273_00325 [Dehalococcoidia bacterium]